MDICAECKGQYSGQCLIKRKCGVHNTDCWDCKDCEKQESQVEHCNFCVRRYREEDMFFCHPCDSYICVHEFECGCTELNQHVFAFLCNFCPACHRKLGKNKHIELRVCKVCREGRSFKPKSKYKQEKVSSVSQSEIQSGSEWRKSQEQEWREDSEHNDPPSQPIKRNVSSQMKQQQTPKAPNKIKTKAVKYLNKREDPRVLKTLKTSMTPQKLIEINLLKKKIKQINESYYLLVCSHVIQEDSALRKGRYLLSMLYALQYDQKAYNDLPSNMLCSFCAKDKKILDCPLCRDPICHQNKTICKQRVRTFEIESFLSTKIENKQKWIEEYKKQTKSNMEIIDAQIVEVQAQISVYNETKKYPQRKREQTKIINPYQPYASNRKKKS